MKQNKNNTLVCGRDLLSGRMAKVVNMQDVIKRENIKWKYIMM